MQREITQEMAKDRLPRREADANKGSFGSVLAAAGSMAYRGAAALCTEGALRAGAGLVYLASVEPVVQMVLTRTPECCACGCRTAANGGIHPQDAGALRSWFDGKNTVLLAGPGLGESAAPVCNALLGKKAPWSAAVLDADALNALAAGQGAALPLALDGPAREPMKLTLDAAALGLTGQALADYLRQNGMECEYADPRYLVLMFTPENPVEDIARLEAALAELCAGGIPPAEPPAEHREAFCALARQAEPRLTVRQAVFVPQETIPAGSALGRVCALPTVSCPPAIPIVVSGEVIGPAALELFAAYGVETVSVVKPEKL